MTLAGLLALVAAGLCACATSPAAPPPAAPSPQPDLLKIQGQLTAEGVECPALRGDDGTLYTLLGDLKGLKAGDRVVVEGTPVQISFCMQGTTLQIKQITRRPASG